MAYRSLRRAVRRGESDTFFAPASEGELRVLGEGANIRLGWEAG